MVSFILGLLNKPTERPQQICFSQGIQRKSASILRLPWRDRMKEGLIMFILLL